MSTAAARGTESAFRLFDLPPELREFVYDSWSSDETIVAKPESEAHVAIKDFPLQNVLLANRQLKEEYGKRAAKRTTAIFSDHENFDFTLIPIPAKMVCVRNLEMRMFVVCENKCPMEKDLCEAATDLRQTIDLISKILLQLPSVISLELYLGLWCRPSLRFKWPEIPHDTALIGLLQKLTEIPQTSMLSIYQSEERCLDASKIVDGRKALAIWTKSSGWENQTIETSRTSDKSGI